MLPAVLEPSSRCCELSALGMGTPAPREQSGFVLPHGGQRAGRRASRGVLGAADRAFFLPAHPRVAPQGCERSQVPPGCGAQGRAPCTHPLPLLGSGCFCPTPGCRVPPAQLGPGDALSPALWPQQPPRALCHHLPAELLHTDRDPLPGGGPGYRRSTRGGRSAGGLARPAKAGWFRPSPSPKG